MSQDEDLHVTRRHLPHWTLKGATYFITFRTKRGTLSLEEQKLALDHFIEGHGKYYSLIAAIVMPDHVHLLLRPEDQFNLSRVMKGIKGVSARKINALRHRRQHIWQIESYDRIVRDQVELLRFFNYILYNPVKKGLADDPWHYHGWTCNLDEIPLQ